ncbi:MAG: oligoendopeptidase F [Oscillospiraceae bacterium]|nr:oligoendopeptidase F [Oscillospiraceae bacterium]
MSIPKRDELDKRYTWALEDIYPDDAAFSAALKEAESLIERCEAMKGHLTESADSLLAYLKLNDEATDTVERLATYCMRKSDEDTGNSFYQGLKGSFMTFYVKLEAAASFATPELLEAPAELYDRYFAQKPELAVYRRYIDRILAKKAHTLSPAEEKLLASAGEMAQNPGEVFSVFTNADMRFPDAVGADGEAHTVNQETAITLMRSSDRVLRKAAFESLYHTFGGFKNTIAACLDAQVAQLRFFAKARGFENTMQASLFETEVPVSVYKNLIEAVHDNMGYMHKYMALRKKLLGLDELHMYDVYVPIVWDIDDKIPFEEAKETVAAALAPLGEEYVAALRKGFDERWIDVYQNIGKRSGAYSSGGRPHPYVLLNHDDDLESEFTLAHEMGHALHTYHSIKNQPTVYSDYVIFVAEVASTCNEALLMQSLLKKTTDKRGRAYLINHFLEQFRTTLYRQTMFAEFEMKINEMAEQGIKLTADVLSELYGKLNEEYYGPDVVSDPEISFEWARIPHFFYNFYVFQYATGFSAAMALSQRILTGGEEAVKQYLGFLSAGSSTDPISILRAAGVDMNTTKPVTDALGIFGDLIDEFEKLLSE